MTHWTLNVITITLIVVIMVVIKAIIRTIIGITVIHLHY